MLSFLYNTHAHTQASTRSPSNALKTHSNHPTTDLVSQANLNVIVLNG